MNLVGYTATALSRNDIEDTPTNKNVVDGAIVELKTLAGDLVTVYDDASGTNPETQKTCDSDGLCTFYTESGDYVLETNGKRQNISLGVNKQTLDNAVADTLAFATNEADRAETAAAASALNGNIYEDTASGLASTVDGDYFSVLSSTVDNYLDLYKNESGAAVFKKSYPSDKFFNSDDAAISFRQIGISGITGEEEPSSTRVGTDFIRAKYLNLVMGSSQQVQVYSYDENKNYINYVFFSGSYSKNDAGGYIRLSVRNSDNSSIVPSDVDFAVQDIDYPSKDFNSLSVEIEELKSSNYVEYKQVLESGSALESWGGYTGSPFISLDIWDRSQSDEFYLNTLYRYYYLSSSGTYVASIGFKRASDSRHISPKLDTPQTNPSLYAAWTVSAAPAGVKTYYLYFDGNSAKEAVGSVTVNWDKIPAGQNRYIGTDGLSPVIAKNLGFTMQKLQVIRQKDITNITNPSYWRGKKIIGLGDSITYGFIPRNAPGYPGQLQSWLPLVADSLEMNFVNYGISGSTLANLGNGTRNPFTTRFQAMDDDADLVIVMGGTNDVRNGVPLGVMSDRTDSTYYGALHVLCEGLIDKYQIQQGIEVGKLKKIMFMTSIKLLTYSGNLETSLEPYTQAVKEVCAYYSIPVFDSYNLSNINPHILKTVQGTEPGYTSLYNPYITDGTHPTQEGHEMWAKQIEGFIKSLA